MDKNNLEQIKNERIGEFKKAFSKMIAVKIRTGGQQNEGKEI